MADQSQKPGDNSSPGSPVPPGSPKHELFQAQAPSSVWKDFAAWVRRGFRSEKPPALVLESQPIPVKDIWSREKPLSSRLTALGIHVVIIGIALLPFWRPVRVQIEKAMTITPIYAPTVVKTVDFHRLVRRSGGGAPRLVLPKLVQTPDPHPMSTPALLAPQLTENVPSFGNIGPVSGPPGGGGGSGGGPGGTGSGSAGGTCVGPNCADAGEVAATSPVIIFKVDPEYTAAARKARFQGTCIVQVQINADGQVTAAHVVQPLGLGLDQKALKAVLLWRFLPARDKYGKRIAVMADIEVNFHLY
ncbi:MAG: energy transducer TonB [Terriglobales bacterium]